MPVIVTTFLKSLAVTALAACISIPAIGATCGVERWAVKTASDKHAALIREPVVPTTVQKLGAIDAPINPDTRRDTRYAETELTVYEVTAQLTLIKPEVDGDYHMVLTDPKGRTMIVESASPDCIAGSRFAKQISEVRTDIDQYLGGPATKKLTLSQMVTVTGIGFFDRIHGQSGVAPNGIELHPILAIDFHQEKNLALLSASIKSLPNTEKAGTPGAFDYYLLSLSWSPEYCNAHPDDHAQCGTQKRYGLVLHGLWPQYSNGGWPESCSTEPLDETIANQYPGLYPSRKLYEHEWSKHGTCSGLGETDYFALSKSARDRVLSPPSFDAASQPLPLSVKAIKQAVTDSNPAIPDESVALLCKGQFLQEIRVCIDAKGTGNTVCGRDVTGQETKSCGNKVLVRNVR